MFARPLVNSPDGGNLMRPARLGDGWLALPSIAAQATDSNQTLTAAQILAGIYQRNGMTAGRSDTTDTAVNILAALPTLDVGESYVFGISVTTAFALTLLAGTGVTLAGKTSVPASGFGFFLVTKTSATTVTITGL